MKQLLIAPAILILFGCNGQNKVKMSEKKMTQTQQEVTSIFPKASDFVKSPLRNRIRLELNAPVAEVWALVGKLERMPEYSSGLEKLDASYDSNNKCTNYTCHFFPMEEGGKVTTHSETIKWYEPNVGFSSIAEEPNILGLKQSLGIVTFEDKGEQTILQWETYFTAENDEIVKMNIMGFEQALNIDISQNLIKKFGGKVLESYTSEL
nr:SRPBCC family protein [uncultured Allomuricauda sp.]